MRTVHDITRERGDDTYTNDHVFQWISEVFADPDISVRSEFGFGPEKDGSFRITVIARPKVKD